MVFHFFQRCVFRRYFLDWHVGTSLDARAEILVPSETAQKSSGCPSSQHSAKTVGETVGDRPLSNTTK